MAKAKTKDKDGKEEKEERRFSQEFQKKFRERIAVLKRARKYAEKDDIPRAVEGYCEYLNIIAAYKRTKEKELKPAMFDSETETAEVLLISQVYWGLAKAYDRNEKLRRESERCLNQFVLFSTGYKFQYLNSEMIRKFLKKNMAYNVAAFEKAHQQIQVDSKKCYLATYCFGEYSSTTNELRNFKQKIVKKSFGLRLVTLYYRLSPPLVHLAAKNIIFANVLKLTLTPIIFLTAHTISCINMIYSCERSKKVSDNVTN